MTNAALGMLAVATMLIGLVLPVYGAVISRQAYQRKNWPEARLAFRAFVAMPVIVILGTITLPLMGLLSDDRVSFQNLYLVSTIFTLAGTVAEIALVIALYRLARQGSVAGSASPESAGPVADYFANLDSTN